MQGGNFRGGSARSRRQSLSGLDSLIAIYCGLLLDSPPTESGLLKFYASVSARFAQIACIVRLKIVGVLLRFWKTKLLGTSAQNS
eukprot:4088685-Amphidinium_carterae.1